MTEDGDDSVRRSLGARALRVPTAARDCSYLSGRVALDEMYLALRVDPDAYQALMDRNFRRSGRVVYRPRCPQCDRCRQLRVPVDEFRPSRSQRRCARRNTDLSVEVAEPRLGREQLALYQRYLAYQHPGTPQSSDAASLHEFLYTSCVDSCEVLYRAGGRLIGVSIVDVSSSALSSVYHFFEPDEARRSLGVYSVLAEIELCRRLGAAHYYLGYWIRGCATMEYKARYYPHEVLVNGDWQRVEARDGD